MTDALAHCTAEPVEVRTLSGPEKVDAHRYGLMAVHRARRSAMFTISHLPTGLAFTNATGLFQTAESAAAAMLEISALKNDWLHIEQRDLQTLGEPIRAIGLKHGGIITGPTMVGAPDAGLNPDVCRRYE